MRIRATRATIHTMDGVPANVTREDVPRLVARGAQIVEVLPREEYDELHVAGAISIPLKELGERAPRELDRSAPVITYCHDFL
jgi:rhodanese-related sulfurtransferase